MIDEVQIKYYHMHGVWQTRESSGFHSFTYCELELGLQLQRHASFNNPFMHIFGIFLHLQESLNAMSCDTSEAGCV